MLRLEMTHEDFNDVSFALNIVSAFLGRLEDADKIDLPTPRITIANNNKKISRNSFIYKELKRIGEEIAHGKIIFLHKLIKKFGDGVMDQIIASAKMLESEKIIEVLDEHDDSPTSWVKYIEKIHTKDEVLNFLACADKAHTSGIDSSALRWIMIKNCIKKSVFFDCIEKLKQDAMIKKSGGMLIVLDVE